MYYIGVQFVDWIILPTFRGLHSGELAPAYTVEELFGLKVVSSFGRRSAPEIPNLLHLCNFYRIHCKGHEAFVHGYLLSIFL